MKPSRHVTFTRMSAWLISLSVATGAWAQATTPPDLEVELPPIDESSAASQPSSEPDVGTLDKVEGKSRCFTYSYDNERGNASVTLYYHNHCAHHKCLEVTFKHRPVTKHVWAHGKRKGKVKYKGVNPDIRHVSQVRAFQCY